MRPVSLADLEVALRMLLAVPEEARRDAARRLVAAAQAGEGHRAATGLLHPEFGSGTLMSAALRHPLAPRPAAYDRSVLSVLSILINAIDTKGTHHTD
ncbi:DUF7742 family protein [Yoonia sp.]|uniref:DUF7742 family protein n=1 Tax=Yoonia sp. TaxID=2212373 RepID=UPI002FD92A80